MMIHKIQQISTSSGLDDDLELSFPSQYALGEAPLALGAQQVVVTTRLGFLTVPAEVGLVESIGAEASRKFYADQQ